jgi:hypothetical protein
VLKQWCRRLNSKMYPSKLYISGGHVPLRLETINQLIVLYFNNILIFVDFRGESSASMPIPCCSFYQPSIKHHHITWPCRSLELLMIDWTVSSTASQSLVSRPVCPSNGPVEMATPLACFTSIQCVRQTDQTKSNIFEPV